MLCERYRYNSRSIATTDTTVCICSPYTAVSVLLAVHLSVAFELDYMFDKRNDFPRRPKATMRALQ